MPARLETQNQPIVCGVHAVLPHLTDLIGAIPYRMAFAGGWIDQPFVSRLNPVRPARWSWWRWSPPSASWTAPAWRPARATWPCGSGTAGCRSGDPAELVRELYAEENRGKPEPSGSQDMIGLIYPGVNRLDFDVAHEGGSLPRAHRVQQRSRRSPAGWSG